MPPGRILHARQCDRPRDRRRRQGLADLNRKIQKGAENLLPADPGNAPELSKFLTGWREERPKLQKAADKQFGRTWKHTPEQETDEDLDRRYSELKRAAVASTRPSPSTSRLPQLEAKWGVLRGDRMEFGIS
jgi:hypothetical protein